MAEKVIFRILNGTDPQKQYDAIIDKDPLTLYLLSTGAGYLGSVKLFDGANGNIKNLITNMLSDGFVPDDTSAASTKAIVDFINERVTSIIDTAPEALDTLKELANALNNDKDFAVTITTEIGKKIDKTSIKNEINEGSTDEDIASSKAIYEFVNKIAEDNQDIKVVSKPKVWELKPGLYRVKDGFYHSNKEEIESLATGITNPSAPGQSTKDYEVLNVFEMLMLVYPRYGMEPSNVMCHFSIFGNNCNSYNGTIDNGSIVIIDDTEYTIYSSSFSKLTKTELIDTDSTNNELATAKAIRDFVQNSIQEALYVDDTTAI